MNLVNLENCVMKNAYLASLSLSLISCYNLGAKVLADGPADAGSTGGALATGGSSAQVGGASNNGGVAGYNSGVQGGAPTVGGSFATGGNSGVDPGEWFWCVHVPPFVPTEHP